MRITFGLMLLALGLTLKVSPLLAGEAAVVDGTVQRLSDGQFRFEATVQHNDQGWDHYANRWEVLLPDGTVVATRVLAHPHTAEPFTRSLSGVRLPEGTDRVLLRAHDSVHGYGGATFELTLP